MYLEKNLFQCHFRQHISNTDHCGGKPVNNCLSYSTIRKEGSFNSQPKSQTYVF